MRKAAVIIGVDRTGTLTPLKSAARGAESVAAWLSGEGFDVACLTDRTEPVTCGAVEDALGKFVTVPPRYNLLLVYFSGHGYWQARTDQWLLSGAPVKAREAVNLSAAMELAKYSGIPNVVFISDACRSIPVSRGASLVDGSPIFPNYDDITTASKIDYFKATSEATSAWEGLVDGAPQSVLTTALMRAFESPFPDMIRLVTDGDRTITVVPNRRLERFLQEEVDGLLAKIDPMLVQQLEINVPSGDDVYIAKVKDTPADVVAPTAPAPDPTSAPRPGSAPSERGPMPAPPPPVPQAPPREDGFAGAEPPAARPVDPGRRAADVVAQALASKAFIGADAAEALTVHDAGTEAAIQERMPSDNLTSFETGTGFGVTGTTITRVLASRRLGAASPAIPRGGSEYVHVQVNTQGPTSVAIQFADGRSTVLPAFPGYLGHIAYGPEGISTVSYVPSERDPRHDDYLATRKELDRLRAMVALAVDRNTFRLGSKRAANEFAQRIRPLKRVDPTLGLYAGIAYDAAGNTDALVSVVDFMREDIGVDLFDLRLLTWRSPQLALLPTRVVPFCPMLTESWNLLATRPSRAPKAAPVEGGDTTAPDLRPIATAALLELRQHLCNSLWTTFEPEGADFLFTAVETGLLE
ncbi:MAG: caspase family protein [Gemmatimonadaceae bacterium]|nr:caspase family protein [Gemmatimonadaceae bacterium]